MQAKHRRYESAEKWFQAATNRQYTVLRRNSGNLVAVRALKERISDMDVVGIYGVDENWGWLV